jgi:hypothetical protein
MHAPPARYREANRTRQVHNSGKASDRLSLGAVSLQPPRGQKSDADICEPLTNDMFQETETIRFTSAEDRDKIIAKFKWTITLRLRLAIRPIRTRSPGQTLFRYRSRWGDMLHYGSPTNGILTIGSSRAGSNMGNHENRSSSSPIEPDVHEGLRRPRGRKRCESRVA